VVYERGNWRIYGIYSLSKVVGEEFCQYFNTEHGLPIIGLRYGTFGSEDFMERGFGMLGTVMHGNMIEADEVVRITLAAIDNENVSFGLYDVQTPLPFNPEDEWAYMQGMRVEILAKYWPKHRALLERHSDQLPPTINTVRMHRTLHDLGVT
jgi:nucleoside-diphosphate-sugar epimerase